MIRFSFLIPAYSIDPTLLIRLLDSIPDREDLEVILLGDIERDVLCSLRCRFSEKTTLVLCPLGQWKGIGDCRNQLLDLANGDYIIFADADDCFQSEVITTLLDLVATTQLSFDILYWGTQTIDIDGKCSIENIGYFGDAIQPVKNKEPFIYHGYESWRKMIRRDYLHEHSDIRFCQCVFAEDVLFSIKALLHTDRIAIYPNVVYSYFKRETSLLHRTWNVKDFKPVLTGLYDALSLLHDNGFMVYHQYSSAIVLKKIKGVSYKLLWICLWRELRSFGFLMFFVEIDRVFFNSYLSASSSLIKCFFRK